MQNVVTQTEELIGEIRRSKEYNQYQRLLENLKRDQGLYNRVNDYRKRNFFMQLDEKDSAFQENASLGAEFEDLESCELAQEFLAAEATYCKMIRKINDQILDCLDLDLDFLDA